MSSNYTHAVVTGSAGYDLIMDFPGKFIDYLHPEKLHNINVSFVVDTMQKQIGGIAVNIAYNIKLVSARPVSVFGAVGKDGKELFDFFAKNNIDTKNLLQDPTLLSSTGTVITDSKDNQIWGYCYGACTKAKELSLTHLDSQTTLLSISSSHPEAMTHFQREAQRLKIDYLYDPGMAMTTIPVDQLKNGVLQAKWFVGNDYEVAQITKLIAVSVEELLKKGIIVITTLGDQGVHYLSSEKDVTVPAYPVLHPVDPTGAGDAWRGGFIAAIMDERSVEDSLCQANALASFAVEKYGTVNHNPTLEEVEERVKAIREAK